MQATKLDIDQFLISAEQFPLVDVRSPSEFALGHIPGAQNIPLFDDHERAEIGTLYKLRGKEDAVERGLEIVSPKLAGFVRFVKSFSPHKKVFIYCWRGGMRSNSFAWLMNTSGLNAAILEGGYKCFRNYVLNYFANKFNLILIGGPTGSGKSEVLRELADRGEQILDLEKIANHKGSAFGGINELPQPTQQLFEHNLFLAIKKLDLTKIIWVEDEAFSIGKNKIPLQLWQQMKISPILKIEVPFNFRVERLVKDYKTTDIDLLRKAILAIQKRLGGKNVKVALGFLETKELAKVAMIALKYYDAAYEHDHDKRKMKNIILVKTETGNKEENAKKLLEAKIKMGKN
jgi:tRNA 2-selenouridine synthase